MLLSLKESPRLIIGGCCLTVLTGHNAKIQFCALGCQEGRAFWRKINTMESHLSIPPKGGGSMRYIIVSLPFGGSWGGYSLTIIFCMFVRKIQESQESSL